MKNNEKEVKRVLFVPSIEKGNGSGHFRRCVNFCISDYIDGKIFIPESDSANMYTLHELFSSVPGFSKRLTVKEIDDTWDLIVLDQRSTNFSFMQNIPENIPVVALDEGNKKLLASADYLIDLLPALRQRNVNVCNPLLGLDNSIPQKAETSERSRSKQVLVSFGGEDAKGLSEITLKVLVNLKSRKKFITQYGDFDITLVQGPLFQKDLSKLPVKIINNPKKLSHLLYKYDVLITSFGITSFESCKAGVPVIHVNPSRYHSKLSKANRFPIAGTGSVKPAQLGLLLLKSNDNGSCESIVGNSYQSEEITLPQLLAQLDLKRISCRGCGSDSFSVLKRFFDTNYLKCRKCSLVFQNRALPHHIKYDKKYFFDDYHDQYGRTYLEDFAHIKEMGLKRMAVIQKIRQRNPQKGNLLDIGCAYGPFLSAAEECGYTPWGVDISEDAVRYISEILNMKGYCFAFPQNIPKDILNIDFSIITMWYVIEHFENLSDVLHTVSTMLPKAGLFCFSTPNMGGISSLSNRLGFLKDSPDDHFSIWSPASAKRVLKRYGFRIAAIRTTGIHKDRFPAFLSRLPGALLTIIAARFHLGDTFEVYAVKE